MADATFAATLQRQFDIIWPHAEAAVNRRVSAPLRVLAASAGDVPPCARAGREPVLFVHLAGMMRSFADTTDHLLSFLDGSASCWLVHLHTLEFAEQREPWWCAFDHRGHAQRDDRALCLARAAAGANTSVVPGLPRAIRPFRDAPHGGISYVVASRAYEPSLVDNKVLQGFAAVGALARATLSHHGLAARRSDFVLHSRPDILYASTIDFARLARLGRRAPPLLLLLRHSARPGAEGIGWNDPSDITWLATRGALERICPAGAPCWGARGAEELRRGFGSCGHAYVALFIHAASSVGIASFFLAVGWRISLLRMHGDGPPRRGYNGEAPPHPPRDVATQAD